MTARSSLASEGPGQASPPPTRHGLLSPGRLDVPATRVHVPMPRRPLVARPRLTERLRVAPHSLPRLVLVAAPAGFGKTTVLTQWLTSDSAAPAEASPRVAWLSLDRGDTDPRRFLAHLLAALRSTSPDLGADALDLMGLEGAPPTDAVLVSLVNDLDTVDGRTVIALDDYHVIDSPAVHEAVTYLIDNLPPRVTTAITTRADPSLPCPGSGRAASSSSCAPPTCGSLATRPTPSSTR